MEQTEKTSPKIAVSAPEINTAKKKELTDDEKKKLETIRKKLLTVRHYNCAKVKDSLAVNGKASHRSKPGVYVWWSGANNGLKPGKYKVVVRIRTDQPGMKGSFGMLVTNLKTKKIVKKLIKIISNSEYKEIELGELDYDASYNIRLSDWSSPGLWVDYVYFLPQK